MKKAKQTYLNHVDTKNYITAYCFSATGHITHIGLAFTALQKARIIVCEFSYFSQDFPNF